MNTKPAVRGQCTFVGGVMEGGKSHFTLGMANRDKALGYPHVVIQHIRGVRTTPKEVTSRSGVSYQGAYAYTHVAEIAELVAEVEPRRIYLADMHFVDMNLKEGEALYRLIISWLEDGRDVVVDTLERDFRGYAFETAGQVYGISDKKHYFPTNCAWPECEAEAHYNQLLHHGRPVSRENDRFETDTPEFRIFKRYEPRCRTHFACPAEIDPELKGILEAQELARKAGLEQGRSRPPLS